LSLDDDLRSSFFFFSVSIVIFLILGSFGGGLGDGFCVGLGIIDFDIAEFVLVVLVLEDLIEEALGNGHFLKQRSV